MKKQQLLLVTRNAYTAEEKTNDFNKTMDIYEILPPPGLEDNKLTPKVKREIRRLNKTLEEPISLIKTAKKAEKEHASPLKLLQANVEFKAGESDTETQAKFYYPMAKVAQVIHI